MTTSPPAAGAVRTALLHAAREELVEQGNATISLRAVARRAGVSHAAPTYFFTDRAGMLTAVATEGFHELAALLHAALAAQPHQPLAALGYAYIDFGLQNRALFDLMFRPSELRADDPQFQDAQRGAISQLGSAVGPTGGDAEAEPPDWALVSWALVHGLTVLARDGGLAAPTGVDDGDTGSTARRLVDSFLSRTSPRQ